MLEGDRLNLERMHVVLLDNNALALDMLATVVAGFGAKNLGRCLSVEEAKAALCEKPADLLLFDAQLPDGSGFDFARWVRWEAPESVKLTPLIMISGHTPESQVAMARDHGVNYIVAKPLSPRVLLQRLHWLATEDRAFIQSETYVGPDRRFKRVGPPAGMAGRRHDDAEGELGVASTPNMSQDQIDALMKPAKVAI
jgi:DNA-binding response OmpR family regulator